MTNQHAPRQPMATAPIPDANATRVAAKKARFEAVRKNHEIPRVRVIPANEDVRRTLKHPRGMAFRSSGGVEWPDDSFTTRRLADGSIKLEKPEKHQAQEEAR